jgi:hypothetical protein
VNAFQRFLFSDVIQRVRRSNSTDSFWLGFSLLTDNLLIDNPDDPCIVLIKRKFIMRTLQE